jgi:hypothetical protein
MSFHVPESPNARKQKSTITAMGSGLSAFYVWRNVRQNQNVGRVLCVKRYSRSVLIATSWYGWLTSDLPTTICLLIEPPLLSLQCWRNTIGTQDWQRAGGSGSPIRELIPFRSP